MVTNENDAHRCPDWSAIASKGDQQNRSLLPEAGEGIRDIRVHALCSSFFIGKQAGRVPPTPDLMTIEHKGA